MKAKMKKLLAWSVVLMLISADVCAIAEALFTITLPKALGVIEDEAFYGDQSLEKVVLPEGIIEIGSKAFADSSLQEINLPASLKSIADNVFEGCKDDLIVAAEEDTDAYAWAVEHGYILESSPIADFEYYTTTGGMIIWTYQGSDENVIVPSMIDNLPVCSINEFAFSGNSKVKSIFIPNSVKFIGHYAFESCSNLTSIELSNKITRIEKGTFSDCYKLEEIRIPEGVTHIEDYAFAYCDRLYSIYVPESTVSIANNALPSNVIIYGKEGTYAEAFAIENGYGFNGPRPTPTPTLIPTSTPTPAPTVVPIEFEYEITDGTVAITGYTGESPEMVIPSVINGLPVEELYAEAFWGNQTITKAVIPSSVKYMGGYTFAYCRNLKEVVFSEGITSINDEFLFWNCSSLTSVYIPQSVISIDIDAFGGCIENLTIYGEEDSYAETFASENGYSFNGVLPSPTATPVPVEFTYCVEEDGRVWIVSYEGDNTDIIIPALINGLAVTGIEPSAFDGCTNLTSVVISDGITIVGSGAFSECKELTSITLPDSITSIGSGTFSSCSSLLSITIPGRITVIEERLFSGCNGLRSIFIPSSVTTIAENAFSYCSPNLIIYGKEGSYAETFANENGYGFNGPRPTPTPVPTATPIPTPTPTSTPIPVPTATTAPVPTPTPIPTSGYCGDNLSWRLEEDGRLVIVGEGAIQDYKYYSTYSTSPFWIHRDAITSVYGEDVTSIGSYAFSDLLYLKDVAFPKVTTIKQYAFSNSGITNVDGMPNVNSIGFRSFMDSDLQSVDFPQLEEINSYAFYDCTKLTSVELQQATSIGSFAFYNCTKLSELILPKVINIDEHAFYKCSQLTTLDLPAATDIGENAFWGCTALSSLNLPVVDCIKDYAFFECKSLTRIYLDSVWSIGIGAFAGCGQLSYVRLNNCYSIGENAFRGGSGLYFHIPYTCYAAGNYAKEYGNSIMLFEDYPTPAPTPAVTPTPAE